MSALKAGFRVRREGWNGKVMWLWLRVTDEYRVYNISFTDRPGTWSTESHSYICIGDSIANISIWNPTSSDLLAEDWETDGMLVEDWERNETPIESRTWGL